ncbi:MAG: LPS export ABC transporter permease LptG [Rhizobiaceae bacterium]|nr:LPS export ABC transporter permease LptG [Rhizobiaceae bacterium]MCV0406456.1 LPS export ABC transporter permease LptG [Rhizobiaceae bacterium]
MIGLTLGSYFLRRYLAIAGWIFFGVFALIFIIDFTEFSNRMSGLPGFSFGLAMAISSLRVPMLMQNSVPFVGLFAAMATLVSLNRKNELVIARSAGISAWQFLAPACIGAILFGLATIFVLNPLAANGLARSENLEADLRTGTAIAISNDIAPWIRQETEEGTTIIGARSILDQGLTMADATFLRLAQDGSIAERLDAKNASLEDGYWELVDVTRRRAGSRPEKVERLEVPTNLEPEFVQERLARPETIPFLELGDKIEAARSFGLSANAFAMHYHSLVALPALLVAMTLIAATVSLRFARMGQSTALILGGILAGFLLYVVTALVTAFGSTGTVPPVVAAWFPVTVGLFYGISFLLYREDG